MNNSRKQQMLEYTGDAIDAYPYKMLSKCEPQLSLTRSVPIPLKMATVHVYTAYADFIK